MRALLLLVAMVLLVVGGGLGFGPGCPGNPVSYGEVEHAMGAACYGQAINMVPICYGTNCQAGGCGCTKTNQFVSGSYTIAPATPCGTSTCTSPQSITGTSCGS